MKETKVYVDELPEDCTDCPCYDFDIGGCQCKDPHFTYQSIDRFKGCPLIDIKTHDREKDKRIKELEQKVQEIQEVDNKRAFRLYSVLYEQLEKEDCENVASRIDYLTGKDYSDICEMYKTAKNIKQHDRELVKEVLEKIRSELEKELKYDFTSYVPIMNVCNKINRVLDQTQKEYEK